LRLSAVAAALLAVVSGLGCERAELEGPMAGGLELRPCAGTTVANAQCGTLEVEENRAAPNGRRLELAIFVAPATSRTPAPDPVFLLAGGPGQGAAELGPWIVHELEPIRRERDLVFVDLRGTGASAPLRCEVTDPNDLAQLLAAGFDFAKLDACLAELDADLTQYTTSAVIDDLEQVRAALGYSQINLIGISYGTRAALAYMRRHGDRTRSAVLDGVVPLDTSVSRVAAAHAERALELLFSDCRADAECAAAFPGLERKLDAVLGDLESNRVLEELVHPRSGEPIRVEITRPGFAAVLRSALYAGALTSLIPRIIDRAHAGDYGPAAAVALQTARMSKTISLGMYFSVTCSEDISPFVAPGFTGDGQAGLAVFDDHLLAQLVQVCERWPHRKIEPDDDFFAPVESTVPTLLLSGRYDPVTPPGLAEHAAATLDHARHVVAANVSHGVWRHGCVPELMAEFFTAADGAGLDASCVDELARPRLFLSPNGPRRTAGPASAERERERER
jgi:pimeloyl-ACP methyl ester carboxylesterase